MAEEAKKCRIGPAGVISPGSGPFVVAIAYFHTRLPSAVNARHRQYHQICVGQFGKGWSIGTTAGYLMSFVAGEIWMPMSKFRIRQDSSFETWPMLSIWSTSWSMTRQSRSSISDGRHQN